MKKVIVLLSFICAVLLGNELETAIKAYATGDYQKAFKHSKIACDDGGYQGCTYLGILYANGQGVEQNYTEAFKYFKIACDNGEYQGCHNLGFLYESGKGVRQSYSMAKEYYSKACDLGSQQGCREFATLNKYGY